MDKKLNTFTLSGLMIGPILGSGIVLLPPIAIRILGEHAVIAWIIMMLLGGIFAYVFAKMSLLTQSNEGISSVISEKMGFFPGQLASNFLSMAVCFGPVAVAVTASDFISSIFSSTSYSQIIIAFIFLVFAFLVLLMNVARMGLLSLILSSLTAILLVTGGLWSLVTQPVINYPSGFPEINSMGYTLLLLSWAIIGWEVIGNYIEDVENPNKTLMGAMKVSLSAVVLVYLISAFALQNKIDLTSLDTDSINMSLILVPVFGQYASFIMGIIAAGLCFCTFIMFVGAASRQIAKRASNGVLPSFFKQKIGEKSPKNTLFTLTALHTLLIVAVYADWISLESVVSISNTFFICNALLGLFASFKCIKGLVVKFFTATLILILLLLLSYSSFIAWILFIGVTLGSAFKYLKMSSPRTL